MSIFPKGQPIIFEPYSPSTCVCDGATFRVPARQSDVMQFQVKVAPCAGSTNVLCNPTFSASEFVCNNWVNSGAWVLDDSACIEDSTGTLTQFGTLVTGNIYQAEINVDTIAGTLYVYNGLTLIASITSVGSTIFTFVATSQDVMLSIDSEDAEVCVTSLTMNALSANMSFGIINAAGQTIDVANFNEHPEYFTFTKDRVTVKFQWSDFSVEEDQCYTIGFADGCTNLNGQLGIFNGGFDSCLSGWTVNPGTIPTIDCESLENPETAEVENCIEFANSGTGNITSYVTTLKIGVSYEVTVTAMSDDADGFLRIYCGTNFADFDTSGDTATIVCAGNTQFKIEAHLQTASFIRVWEVTLGLTSLTDTEFDYESNVFHIGANQCTHLLNLSNDDDGMGFVFEGSGFAPQIRLESEIFNHQPETIKESYHDNLGTKQVNYGEVRFAVFLNIDYVPPWVGFFLSLCNIADHFFVDGVEYFIEQDELEPTYPENVCFVNMAAYKIPISEKTQLFRNADIGNDSNPITYAGDSVLVDANGNTITDLFTGTAIDIPL